jgi:hypothetical protein
MLVMLSRLRRALAPCARRQQGSVAVEFAIIVPVFLLLVFGIVDLGHAWYLKQVISNASREGARYGAKYHADPVTGIQIKPNTLNPSIINYVNNTSAQNGGLGGWGLKSLLPADGNPWVLPGGAGYTSGVPGDDLSVTVTATKTWFVLGTLVPGWGNSEDLSATTIMKCE